MNPNEQSPIPRFPIRLLAGALVLTAASMIWLAWNVYDSNRFVEELKHRHIRCVQFQGVIIHLDEVLTMSARMAAATGDLNWEKRYRHYEPELDAAIKEATQLAPQPALVQMAAQTDVANLKLVDMEHRAFDLVRHGQLEQARVVLFSPAYEEQKQVYAAGITHLLEELNKQWNAKLDSKENNTRLSILISVLVLVALLAVWFGVMRTLTRWRTAFRHAHDSLEARVQERTIQLTDEITVRGRAEEQSHLQGAALEAAANAIVITDCDGTIRWVNPAFTTLTGYTREEIIGKNPRVLKSGKHDTAFYAELWRTVRAGNVWQGELINRRKDGSEYTEEMTITPLRNERSEIGHFIAIQQEVTDRRRAEAALHASEKRYRTLFEGAAEGILVADIESRQFKYANPAICGMLGYTAEELMRLGVADIHPKEALDHVATEFEAQARGEKTLAPDIPCLRKDGSVIYTDIVSAAVVIDGRKCTVGFFTDITERKRAGEALRKSDGKYRDLFEGSRDAIMTVEPPSWKFTSGNPATLKMFGAKNEEEFLSHGPGDLSPERQPDGRASAEKAREMTETAMREGSHFFEWTYRRIGGEEFPADVLLTRMEWEGKVIVQATVRDITERKQAEEELKKMLWWQQGVNALQQSLLAPARLEDKLRMITDSIVRLFDADFCRIWLIRPGDLCERDCIHAEVKEGPHICRYRDKCLHLLASSGRYTHTDGKGHRRVPFGCYKIGRVASGEDHKFLTNDAQNDPRVHNHEWARELGLVSFAGYQLRVPGGETLGVLALFAKNPISPAGDAMLDGLGSAVAFVLQQAIAEEAMRGREATLHGITDSAQDAILMMNPQGNVSYWNPAAEHILGYTRNEALGQNLHELLAPQRDQDAHQKAFPGFQWTGHGNVVGKKLELDARCKDGREILVELSLSAVQIKGGWHGVGIIRDITERKRAERVLEETNKRLSNALDELETAHEQAFQQERLRALGTMASGIAHDFNNSLTPILGGSQLLLHQPGYLDDKEQARSCIEMMNTAAQDAGNIVNRLREFYRPREENEAFAPVDLNELVNQAISLTQPKWRAQAEVRGVSVNVHTDLQEVPAVAGNAAELREALTNLILNATDAMPRGGTITIHTYRDDGYVVLEISDTGTGMTQEVRRRCLEPFFTTKGARGTGLGLSMVYGILQRHQGTVDIETELGKGTTFIIRLPVQAAQPRSEPKAPPVDAIQPLHVLVVDDEAAVRKIIGEYLKIDGHIVEAANSGRDGLEKFRNSRFDLVLLDRAMPDMSGDQVATAIKSANPAVPVIMLTGFGSMMEAADEKPTGVDFIVGKPVTINALRAALSQAVASVN